MLAEPGAKLIERLGCSSMRPGRIQLGTNFPVSLPSLILHALCVCADKSDRLLFARGTHDNQDHSASRSARCASPNSALSRHNSRICTRNASVRLKSIVMALTSRQYVGDLGMMSPQPAYRGL